ncbi:MAG: sigma-70 family RNA polymerase sigma factor [Clostridia bacterium]|nr:sigma-70 family RNA polymerase sigma factor [Clostridia bacterium]MDD4679263.1 sigma-70 family RNA polymerase sigma factor [Clostridia bacterium]
MSGESLLIEEAKAGSFDAFAELIFLYEKKIYNYCLRMTNCREDAEDLTQEVFVRVYKNLKGFQGNSRLSTWIFRIAHNICIDHFRKSKFTMVSLNQPKNYEDQREMELPSEDPTPEQEALRKEQQEFLLKSIENLRPEYKTVIILRDIQHHSYEEIAEILDVPLGTVKSHISRARTALRTAVRPLLQGDDEYAL